MTNIPDPLHDIVAACEVLKSQLAEQNARIEALERENQQLREQTTILAGENAIYLKLYKEQLDKEYERHPDEVEAEWESSLEEARRNPEDIWSLIRELEASASKKSKGG